MIIVDASVIADFLLRLPEAHAIEQRIAASGESLHAPHLLDIEVAQVVRRYTRAGFIDAVTGGRAIADLAALPVQRYAHEWLLPRVWALRNNITAYDAIYVALAEALDGVLLTKDRRLAKAASGFVQIEVI